MDNIQREYLSPIDMYSQDLMVSHLDVLLNYTNRFYNRQFITRKTASMDILVKIDDLHSSSVNVFPRTCARYLLPNPAGSIAYFNSWICRSISRFIIRLSLFVTPTSDKWSCSDISIMRTLRSTLSQKAGSSRFVILILREPRIGAMTTRKLDECRSSTNR